MKRKIAILLILAVVLSAAVSAAATARTVTKNLNYTGTKIFVNGIETTLKDANGNDVEPFIIDGTTYLPVRGVASALGSVVIWDGEQNRINIFSQEEYSKAVAAHDKNAYEKYYVTDPVKIDFLYGLIPPGSGTFGDVQVFKTEDSSFYGVRDGVILDVIIKDDRVEPYSTRTVLLPNASATIAPSIDQQITQEYNSTSYTVYITKTGTKYHTANCGYLKDSKIAIDINDAIARGYEPCKRCRP